MHLLQMFIIYMGIDLGRRDGSMSEKGLYGSYVSAFSDEGGSETMSEGMWAHFLSDSCQSCIFFYDIFDAVSTQMLANFVFGQRHEKIGTRICPELKIGFQCVDSFFGREYGSEFGSFSDNGKLVGI